MCFMADPGTLTLTQVLHGWPTYINDSRTVVWLTQVLLDWLKYIWLTHIPWGSPKCFMADQSTWRLIQLFYCWPKNLEADPSISWLIKVSKGWPKCFMVDPSTLRMAKMFYGWLKYLETFCGRHECFLANPRTLRLTQVFQGWHKYFMAEPSVSWLPGFLAAYPSILWLTQVFLG